MKTIHMIGLLPLAVLMAHPAAGISLRLAPANPTVAPGDSVSLTLNISGLGSGTAPSLGTYDIDIDYDTGVLSFDGAVNDTQLDVLGLGSIFDVTPGAGGTVNLFELSLDSVADLVSLQLDSFVLATLTFTALAPGTSPVTLAINALGDELGAPLPASVENASVTVSGGGSSVPDSGNPTILLGVASGLLYGCSRLRPRTS